VVIQMMMKMISPKKSIDMITTKKTMINFLTHYLMPTNTICFNSKSFMGTITIRCQQCPSIHHFPLWNIKCHHLWDFHHKHLETLWITTSHLFQIHLVACFQDTHLIIWCQALAQWWMVTVKISDITCSQICSLIIIHNFYTNNHTWYYNLLFIL